MLKRSIISFLTLLLMWPCYNDLDAQVVNDHLEIRGNLMVIRFDKKDPEELEALAESFGINVDSLFNFGHLGIMEEEGWQIIKHKKNLVMVGRSLEGMDIFDFAFEPFFFADIKGGVPGTPGYPTNVQFGSNRFKDGPSVYEDAEGFTVFTLEGRTDATQVFLSGSFNSWSTLTHPMERTDTGWELKVKLEAGKYLYKFIVDGYWTEDPANEQQEWDGHGGNNSAYYKTNYQFELNGFAGARKVVLAGSFNDWNESEWRMEKVEGKWILPVYLREGTYTYKFIVDKEWMLDPANPNTREDGYGNTNSVFSIGDTTLFTLNGYAEAERVMLAGSFNGWNANELEMQKTSTGWELPYVLGAGNYEYRFVVDGDWVTDPSNPITVGQEDFKNSLLVIAPNHTFSLDGFKDVKEVRLSGSFNGWADPGYTMQMVDSTWTLSLHLDPGKYTYKFVVDGNWMHDPGNDQREPNEYNEFNSFIWIEPDLLSRNQ